MPDHNPNPEVQAEQNVCPKCGSKRLENSRPAIVTFRCGVFQRPDGTYTETVECKLAVAERERDAAVTIIARLAGWQIFPYSVPSDPRYQQLWCAPGERVFISNAKPLPPLPELAESAEARVSELAAERDEAIRLLRLTCANTCEVPVEEQSNSLADISLGIESLVSRLTAELAVAKGKIAELQRRAHPAPPGCRCPKCQD